MNENLKGRLFNWKFRQACNYLKGESEEVQKSVKSLAYLFEDCGWFDGAVADKIEGYVNTLISKEEEKK